MDNREAIARVQHEIWSYWMRYLLSVCYVNHDGTVTIPAEKAIRWNRQMKTAYFNLSDEKKESDLSQADKVLEILGAQLAEWERVGNAIMLCATGNEAPLSDSDVCGVIADLRAQVAEMRAQIIDVPTDAISRFFDYGNPDEKWAESAEGNADIYLIEKWLGRA